MKKQSVFKNHLVLKSFGLLLITLISSSPSFGQQANSTQDTEQDVVRRIRFSGNNNVKDRTLETLIRTRINREFLGIPRFTPWYYIWRVTNGRFGEEPIYLSREIVSNDMERISLYYESLGYFEVEVDTTIIEYRDNRVEVSFLIDEGEASTIESISYSGIPVFPEAEKRTVFLRNSPLTRARLNDTTFTVRRQYNTQELSAEQARIIDFMKNNGYASIQRDSVIALVKRQTDDPNKLDVQFRVNPGRVFRFGDIHIRLDDGRQPLSMSDTDTLTDSRYVNGDQKIFLSKEPATQTKFSLLSDQILFKPGDVYNHELYLNSIREFQNLGMLFIRRFGQSEEGVQPNFGSTSIPTYVDLQTLTKHSVGTELFGMRRYGFGTGFGVDYSNNNVFGKAENFTLGANASFEFVTQAVLDSNKVSASQSSVLRSYELRGDYTVPRLNFPFAFLDNTPYFTSGLTRYSLSYSRSDQLDFDINSDVQFNFRYEVNHSPRFSSFLDLIELDVVDPSPTDAFRQRLFDQYVDTTQVNPEIPFELTRILEDFRPQISSVIRYTFRSQRTDPIKRNQGYFSEYSVSAGGNIPYALDQFFITPDTLEGNLPSLFGLGDNPLSYSRYVKLTADYRRYYPISDQAVFAWRLFGGLAQPYGGSSSVPLNRRFFAGGSNDIRGWGPFQLGPGDIPRNLVSVNGGEIKLAAFTEARQVFLRNVFSADWHAAWYVDAGNIWYGPLNETSNPNDPDNDYNGFFKFDEFYKQIAVGTGLGLRLDWDYVVARFDFTFRAHDLEMGWFNNRKMYFSFGIGHSF